MSSAESGTRPPRSATAKSASRRPLTVSGASVRKPARLSRATAAVGRSCELLAREARRPEARRGRQLGERESAAAVHGPAVRGVARHAEERRARHAEPAGDARDEEVRELGERPRGRQLAQESEKTVAVARVVAVLEPAERGRKSAPDGHEAERHQEARGGLKGAAGVRDRERERVGEEHLREREEARPRGGARPSRTPPPARAPRRPRAGSASGPRGTRRARGRAAGARASRGSEWTRRRGAGRGSGRRGAGSRLRFRGGGSAPASR